MKFLKMLKYDLRFGLLKQWKVYIIAIFVAYWSMRNYDIIQSGTKSVFDYWCFLFEGQARYYFSNDGIFRIPVYWIILFILPAFIIGDYAVSDLHGFGKGLIIKNGSRFQWAIAKIFWCIISVFLYVSVLMITVIVYSVAKGASFDISVNNYSDYLLVYINVSKIDVLIQFILLPVISIITICIIQLTLTMFCEPIIAYVIIISYDVLSVYFTSSAFIGNYAMVLRNNRVVEDGLNFVIGIFVMSIIIFVSISTYLIRISKKNII